MVMNVAVLDKTHSTYWQIASGSCDAQLCSSEFESQCPRIPRDSIQMFTLSTPATVRHQHITKKMEFRVNSLCAVQPCRPGVDHTHSRTQHPEQQPSLTLSTEALGTRLAMRRNQTRDAIN